MMPKDPLSTSTRVLNRLAALFSAFSAFPTIATILFCNVGVAFSSEENDRFDPGIPSVESGRAKGLAYIDLPLRLRARFDSTYSDEFYVSDELAKPYVTNIGPDFRRDRSLESRITLTQAISEKIEVGIVWGARSPLGNFNLFDFQRQTVGAMIRIVP